MNFIAAGSTVSSATKRSIVADDIIAKVLTLDSLIVEAIETDNVLGLESVRAENDNCVAKLDVSGEVAVLQKGEGDTSLKLEQTIDSEIVGWRLLSQPEELKIQHGSNSVYTDKFIIPKTGGITFDPQINIFSSSSPFAVLEMATTAGLFVQAWDGERLEITATDTGKFFEFKFGSTDVMFSGNSAGITAPKRLFMGNGTAAEPAISWASDANTGIYRVEADKLGFSTNGANRMTITNNGIGINETAPVFELDLSNGTETAISFLNTGFTAGLRRYNMAARDGVFKVMSYNDAGSSISTDNILSFSHGGNIGVGVAPGSGLMELKYNAGNSQLAFRDNVGDLATWSMDAAGTLRLQNDGAFTIQFTKSANTVIRPAATLGVGAANNVALAIGNPASSQDGFYKSGSGVLNVSTGGTERFRFGSANVSESNLFIQNGTIAAPGLAFESDTDTGYRWISSGRIGTVCDGIERMKISSAAEFALADDNTTTHRFATNSMNGRAGIDFNLPTGGAVKMTSVSIDCYVDQEIANSFVGLNCRTKASTVLGALVHTTDARRWGFTSTTAGGTLVDTLQITDTQMRCVSDITYLNDSDTGMRNVSPNVLGFFVGDSNRLQIETGQLLPGAAIRQISGTLAEPAYSFSSNTSLGISRTGANTMSFSANAIEQLRITPTTVGLADGTIAAPCLSFSSDTNTGFYKAGEDILGVSTGGAARIAISATELAYTNSRLRLNTAETIANGTVAGVLGQMCGDANYMYRATATNTWKRLPLQNFPLTVSGVNLAGVSGTVAFNFTYYLISPTMARIEFPAVSFTITGSALSVAAGSIPVAVRPATTQPISTLNLFKVASVRYVPLLAEIQSDGGIRFRILDGATPTFIDPPNAAYELRKCYVDYFI